ncbi:MAG TPA: TonB-dependent receptor [Gammaproteobacteria bacterium]
MLSRISLAVGAVLATATSVPADAQPAGPTPQPAVDDEITVTGARRREEAVQEVPIPVSVVDGELITDAGAFNVNRIKELIPSVQLYSSNPRNTGVNVRGLGSPFGLTNDGIEPGVGYYVDGVLYARPAATTLDFIDVERVEVLRGPQGTLFGKNTTAGASLVTTRKPTFIPEYDFELGYGDHSFAQAKGSISGPLGDKVAGRVSFSSTQRDGLLYNVSTQQKINDLDNVGVRTQLLVTPNDRIDLTFALDYTNQEPTGYAQVFAGAVPTQRSAYRQFETIIADLNYQPPSRDPFDRLIDHDTEWRSGNELGGASANVDIQLGPGTLTSTTAWRYWKWDPSNDRDYLGLPVGTLSQAPSTHDQFTQEIRWAGTLSDKLEGVFGLFAFDQKLNSDPVHTEQAGSALYRFLWTAPNTPAAATSALFDGYTSEITSELNTVSAALFGQLDWAISERVHLLPGLRVNYDQKDVDFVRRVSGGPANPTAAELQQLLSVYRPQAFTTDVSDNNVSGQLTLQFAATDRINAYSTYATSFKSIGVNLGGLPLDANNNTILDAAEVAPEDVTHIEVGVKISPTPGSTANFTLFDTHVEDFQTQVNNAQFGVARGYLANADKVRVKGAEFDGNVNIGAAFAVRGSVAYTDAKYVSFIDAPPPLEGTGGPAAVDASGGKLPGISEWAASFGTEYRAQIGAFGGSELFTGVDVYYRDDFSSSATPSAYLNVEGYSIVNLRLGFRANDGGWSGYLWTRNALDEDYFEQLLAAPAGNGAGHYGAVLGDPRTYGVTLRLSF